MTVLRSIIMAFSCFSQIPMPHVKWEPESMRYMMCFFPFVGAVVGLLLAGWVWLCSALGFGPVFQAVGITLIPLVVSGGIHMDGFADTCDALASNAPPEKRRAILKDSHCGAFAVIGVAAYMIAYFGLASEFNASVALVHLAVAPFFVRCLSGIATVAFKMSSGDGMLASFHDSAETRIVLGVLAVFALAACVVLVLAGVLIGVLMICAAIVCLVAVSAMARKLFGGMSGDLAGFFLQVCELTLLACIVVGGKVVGL